MRHAGSRDRDLAKQTTPFALLNAPDCPHRAAALQPHQSPARQESFNFLGYTFGPHRYKKDGRWYLGASPSKKALARIKEKVWCPATRELGREVRDRLNQILRGWSAYFSYGNPGGGVRCG